MKRLSINIKVSNINTITQEEYDDMLLRLNSKELSNLYNFINSNVSRYKFNSYAEYLLAVDMFRKGYLASYFEQL